MIPQDNPEMDSIGIKDIAAMVITVEALKSNILCSILAKNDWSFTKESVVTKLTKELIHEATCWYGRRGNPVSWEALEAVIGRNTKAVDMFTAGNVHTGLRRFYNDHYKDLRSPVSRQKLEIEFRDSTLVAEVPIIDEGKVVEFYLFESIASKELLFKSILTRFVALWASLKVTSTVKIHNINISSLHNCHQSNALPNCIKFKPPAYIPNNKHP